MDGEPVRKMAGLADSLDGKSRALTVADIAQLLNISERQVYKLAAEHRIPCFKIGGCIRFDPLAVAVWLRQKMAPAPVSLQPPAEDRLLVMEGRTPRRR
jgi:excisionase family DNA binding protein